MVWDQEVFSQRTRGRFKATFAFPAEVRGPVERPPCHLQRPPLPRPLAWQGVPLRVRAPHFEVVPVSVIDSMLLQTHSRTPAREQADLTKHVT